MCFSPEADLVAAAVVGAVGVDALRHVRRREQLLLAGLPLLFAVHQFIEAVVWWSLDHSVSPGLGRAALWRYLVIAFTLPVLVPLAVRALEPMSYRREAMTWCAGLGAGVTGLLLVEIGRGPIAAHASGLHVSYDIGHGAGAEIVVLYVMATCGALLVSSFRLIAVFGVVNLVAVTTLAIFASNGLPSLWCFWAAVTSVTIAVHLRRSTDPVPGAVRGSRMVPSGI
jgi:hypothetical protein